MTIDEYLHAMCARFAPERAAGRSAVLQYVFSGRVEGICHAVIHAGQITVAHGAHSAPTAVVTSDFDLWMRILGHQVDGLLAYQEGLFHVTGDVLTLMDSDLWFAR